MSAKNSRSGANKLSNALESYEESLNRGEHINNKSKLAIKALREVFGQSLKITSQSSHEGDYLTQSIAFAINSGKFDELLAEQSLTSTIQALEKIAPNSLPSRTLHSMATVEALCLMGFDVELSIPSITAVSYTQPVAIQPAPQAAPTPKPEEAPSQTDDAQESSDNPEPIEANTSTEPSASEEDKEAEEEPSPTADLADVEGDNLVVDDKQSDEKSPTENEENAPSRTEELSTLINEQEVDEVSDEPQVKTVSHEIIGRIIESMRELDLSEKAVLSRLRSTTATTIHDLTQPEGYRITNWLNASNIDSSDVVKKRKKFGGFTQHLPETAEPTTEPAAAKTQDEPEPKAKAKPAKKAPAKTDDKDASDSTDKAMTPVVKKALGSYLREKSTNDAAPELAVAVIKEITGIDTTPDDIEDLITELEDKQAKQFRAKLSALILINN